MLAQRLVTMWRDVVGQSEAIPTGIAKLSNQRGEAAVHLLEMADRPERTDAHVGQISVLNDVWLKEQTPRFNDGWYPSHELHRDRSAHQ